jgi:hypothetical protein
MSTAIVELWCRKEAGHVLLHDRDDPDAVTHRGIAEVEAESVALMVAAAHHGMDTSGYTIPYVSTWASRVEGQDPIETVKQTAIRVRDAAVTILDHLDTQQLPDGDPPGLDRDSGPRGRTSAPRPDLAAPAADPALEPPPLDEPHAAGDEGVEL